MPQIRISVDEEEWSDLESRSTALGFMTVTDYARTLLFPSVDYSDKWHQVVAAIEALPSGATFRLRDLIPAPPARFGVYLHQQAEELGIRKLGKDRIGVWKWEKKGKKE